MERRGFLLAIPAVVIARRLHATGSAAPNSGYVRFQRNGQTWTWSVQSQATGRWLNASAEWQVEKMANSLPVRNLDGTAWPTPIYMRPDYVRP